MTDNAPKEYLGAAVKRSLSRRERWRAAVALILNRPLPPYLKVKDYSQMRLVMAPETWDRLHTLWPDGHPLLDAPTIRPYKVRPSPCGCVVTAEDGEASFAPPPDAETPLAGSD